jgi:hypothetical protein
MPERNISIIYRILPKKSVFRKMPVCIEKTRGSTTKRKEGERGREKTARRAAAGKNM